MLFFRSLDNWIRLIIKRKGYVFMRQTNPFYYLGRRMMLMRSYGIDLVLDVGANTGQYAQRLRTLGYKGEIVSFEPMAKAFVELQRNSTQDAAWSARNIALGDATRCETLHISNNSVSSSLLPMLAEHQRHAPSSVVIGEETVNIERLDALPDWPQWASRRGLWLKLDVQGYEHQVLAGATQCLERIAAIQIELSLRPLYAGQATFLPMMQHLADLGFDPVAFEPGFADMDTGEYLQVDGIFRNRQLRQ